MLITDPLERNDSSGAVHKHRFTFQSTDYQPKSQLASPSATFRTAHKSICVEKR